MGGGGGGVVWGYWERDDEKIKFPKKLRSGLRKGKGKNSTWDGTGIGGERAPTSAPTWMDGARLWASFSPLSPLSVVSAK